MKKDRHLFIISAYRTCPTPSNKVLTKFNSQQCFILRDKEIQNPNPRRQFVDDMRKYIQNLKLRDRDMLLLMMDANKMLEDHKLNNKRRVNGFIYKISKHTL